jgi:hypothetical protein
MRDRIWLAGGRRLGKSEGEVASHIPFPLPQTFTRLPWFMRVAHPSVWFQKSNKSPRPPDSDHLAPTNKADPRPSSASSLVPPSLSYSNRSTPTLSHPFALMAHAPLPVVSSHDSTEDEEDCPVCLEPLSFSFRLPGEKPHIVPECGHALHEVCFFHLSSPCLVRSCSPGSSRASFREPSSPRPRRRGSFILLHPPLAVYHPHFSPSAPHLRARARTVEKLRGSYRIR